MIGILLGIGAGAFTGYYGKCSTGACPLTANPFRGALYGAFMGAMIVLSMGSNIPAENETAENKSSSLVHITNSDQFNNYVLQSKLPCLVDFYSENCGPCRMLGPVIGELAEKYKGLANVCKVSLDAAPEMAEPYSINAIPAVIFFENGREVSRLTGLQGQTEYEKTLDGLISKNKTKVVR